MLCSSLRNYLDLDQYYWLYLPPITLNYNTTPQIVNQESTFYIMHSFAIHFPIDNKIIQHKLPDDIKQSIVQLQKVRDEISKRIKNAQNLKKKHYDKNHKIIYNFKDYLVLVESPFYYK